MKRYFLFYIALLMISAIVQGQTNITIKGETVDAAGKKVMLGGYTDKISCQEIVFDTCTINEQQQFEVHCFARYPMLVFLQIENYSQSFYVEPGGDYRIYIPRFDWNQDERRNVFLDPVTLPVEFISLPAADVNAAVSRLDAFVDKYIADHRCFFDERYKPQKRYFDSLLAAVDKACPDGELEFFNRYKRYHLAQLRLDMKFASRQQLYNTYLLNQPVLCYDENYMAFFSSFYRNFLSMGTRKLPLRKLSHMVNNNDYQHFIDTLGVEPLLRHEQIRELAALQALKEFYYNPDFFDGSQVRRFIECIRDHSKFADHRTIAQNVLNSLQGTRTGSTVQTFLLPDVDKHLVSLENFRGKWVYLSFLRLDEPACLGEIETLAHFRDTVYANNDNVAFVSICCDREFQKMYHFLKNSKHGDRYHWIWLHFDGDYEMLNRFRVVSYPTFILINPEGELQYNITPNPSTGFLLSPPWKRSSSTGEEDEHSGSYFLNR